MEQYSLVVGLWQSYIIEFVADLDKYLDSFRILFAFHSGKIENEEITYNDTREIFENSRVVSYTGSPRALFEQQNQKLCYEVNLLTSSRDKITGSVLYPLSFGTRQSFHTFSNVT